MPRICSELGGPTTLHMMHSRYDNEARIRSNFGASRKNLRKPTEIFGSLAADSRTARSGAGAVRIVLSAHVTPPLVINSIDRGSDRTVVSEGPVLPSDQRHIFVGSTAAIAYLRFDSARLDDRLQGFISDDRALEERRTRDHNRGWALEPFI